MRRNWLFACLDRHVGRALCIILTPLSLLARRLAPALAVEPSRILLIKLSALGDTILLIPAVRALRRRFPDARISMVCTPLNAEVVQVCPYVDEAITIEVGRFLRNPLGFLRFLISLGRMGFDLVIDADQWLRLSALISFFSGARRSVGFKTPGQLKHLLFTDKVEHRRDRHEVDCFLDLLRETGLAEPSSVDDHLEFWVSEEDIGQARARLDKIGVSSGFVVVHPGVPSHGWQRQWPAERFGMLCKRIVDELPGTRVVVTGTHQDRSIIASIMEAVGGDSIGSLTGLSVKDLAGVLSLSNLVVCNNTGVLHLSCAVGAPVVAIHGPTDAARWGPRSEDSLSIQPDVDCSPCLYLGFEYGCKTARCMEAVGVDEVFSAVRTLHGRASSRV